MKKRIYCALFAAIMLLSACTKDQVSNSNTGFLRSFRAQIEDLDTKASINLSEGSDSYGKVSFEQGDQVKVSNGKSTALFTYNATKGEFETSDTQFEATGEYTAVYPAAAADQTFAADGSIGVTLSANQDPSDSKISAGVMHATGTSTSLLFRNLCGLVKLKLQGTQALKSITFRSAQTPCQGAAIISKQGVLTMQTGAGLELSLPCTGQTLEQEGNARYFALPAGLYTGGFELDIEFSDGSKSLQSTTNDILITASKIDAMKLFTASSETFSGGKGTAADPWLIATRDDLQSLCAFTSNTETAAKYASAHYRITRDIDFTGATALTPACSLEDVPFSGTLDGCNHTLTALKIENKPELPCGLFAFTRGATVKNLTVDADYTASALNTGGIAGKADESTFQGCCIKGKIYSTAKTSYDGYDVGNTGGVAGLATKCTIEECLFQGTVITDSSTIGGMAGHALTTTFLKCTVAQDADINASAHFVGGIAGRARENCTFDQCNMSGRISAYSGNYIGGITSHLTSGVIKDCVTTATADIAAKGNHAGGICGALQPNETGAYTTAGVEGCTVYCKVFGAQNVGGICGYQGATANHKSWVKDCTSYGAVKGGTYNAAGISGTISASGECHIERCKSYGEVYGEAYNVGGICGYAVNTAPCHITDCAAYGNLQGLYAVGGIVGYIKTNSAAGVYDVVNCLYAGKVIDITGNNGANGYTLGAGIVSWLNLASSGKASIINCVARVQQIKTRANYVSGGTTYPSKTNTVGGIIGFQNGAPAACTIWGCYASLPKSGVSIDGGEFTSTHLGGVYAKIDSKSVGITKISHCWFPESMSVIGPGASSVTGIDAATTGKYSSASELLEKMNAAVTAYNGTYTLLDWVADTDTYPVLKGMTAQQQVSTAKRISVIGDSISTFRGFVPNGYGCHYPTADWDLTHVDQTYWHLLAYKHMSDAVIDRNIAFSGTAVARTTNTSYSSQSWFGQDFCARFKQQNGVGTPDIILIHGGTNDYAHNCDKLSPSVSAIQGKTIPEQSEWNSMFSAAEACTTLSQAEALNDTTFCEAYIKLIRMINIKYPNVKVVCIIGDYISECVVNSILEIANHYDNLKAVNLYAVNGYNDQTYMPKHDYNPQTGKGCHPSAKAMKFIAEKIYTEVGAWLEN